MAEQFDHLLNECIDRLLRGESLEQCLQRYPEHAVRLEPLLRVAQAAYETSSTVEPRADFKAQARYRMGVLLHDRKQSLQFDRYGPGSEMHDGFVETPDKLEVGMVSSKLFQIGARSSFQRQQPFDSNFFQPGYQHARFAVGIHKRNNTPFLKDGNYPPVIRSEKLIEK